MRATEAISAGNRAIGADGVGLLVASSVVDHFRLPSPDLHGAVT